MRTLPHWLAPVLVACDRLPGCREALIGELVVGDEESARLDAVRWVAMLERPADVLRLLEVHGGS